MQQGPTIRDKRYTVMNYPQDSQSPGIDPTIADSVKPNSVRIAAAVVADGEKSSGSANAFERCVAGHDAADRETLEALLRQWNDEHLDLAKSIRDTTLWLGQVSQRGIPRFGELAARLSSMRQRMTQHFEREEALGDDLQQTSDCVEVKTTRQRAINDHQHLIQRVDDLILKLSELDPPFASFQQAIDLVGLFVDAFEQHEEQEAQGLQWLTNYNSDPRRMPR
jgi:hypothetical protein